ncbi:uncharacterized protein METZ01_LOCUS511436, partial [marine metagenome]
MRREPIFFSTKRTLRYWLVAGAGAWLILACALPAPGIDRAIDKEKEKDLSFDTVYRNPGKPLERDSINPIFARKYKGTLLDLTNKYAVIDSWRGKSFIPRAEVGEIKRAGDAQAITLFEKYRKRAKSLEDWVKLEAFASKQELIPERRTCIRRLLEKDPSNL